MLIINHDCLWFMKNTFAWCGKEKNFAAVSNRCTHNGESLSKGKVNFANEIVCPLHGYQFDLRTGREYQQRAADLETFPIKIEADGVYIGL
ncbi:MAG: ferredoxin subunit of nitrite reductase and ring-hydroxylating dioxygenase [Bacteroidetes bacterium OLB12]|nr:MAG: ferredoxin subunit of nitrite reductase and ring-hydroxylating dioxygenase [Bacteroidetes bacterium OLB12]